MEDLNMIMSNFVEVECGLISLSTVLAALEEAYEFDGKKELRDNILVIKRQIDSLPSIKTKDSTNYGYSVLFCPYLFYVS